MMGEVLDESVYDEIIKANKKIVDEKENHLRLMNINFGKFFQTQMIHLMRYQTKKTE